MAELAETHDYSFLDEVGTDSAFGHLTMDGAEVWRVNDSDMSDYSRRARIDDLQGVIRRQIGVSEENVGLDIAAGSTPRALRDLLGSGIIGQALATNYLDCRPESVREDGRLGHIGGDIRRLETWNNIVAWQQEHAPDGFAVAMHRPVGGLQELPPGFYLGAVHTVLDTVRPEGLMFTQIPRSLVREPDTLDEVCHSIYERPDVTKILASPEPPDWAGEDNADLFALIHK